MAVAGNVDDDVEAYLNGNIPSQNYPVCDVSLGISTTAVLRRNVTYIVAAVLFDEAGKVLFIQEAKMDCRGHWYLPAGRMERNESFEEAAKREVLEEAGFEFQPTAVIFVESNDGAWIRVTFTGTIVGGNLKTLKEADDESLQADWLEVKEDGLPVCPDIKIRSYDITQLIKAGIKHKESASRLEILPVLNPYDKVCLRPVIVIMQKNTPHVLLCDGRLPLVDVYYVHPIQLLSKVMSDTFGEPLKVKIGDVLAIEHVGKPHGEADGLCITCLVSVETDKPSCNSLFQLRPITKQTVRDEVLSRLQDKKVTLLFR